MKHALNAASDIHILIIKILHSMATRPILSNAASIELARVALTNVESQPEVAAAMADFTYDSAKIAEGNAVLASTRAAFDFNKLEDDETAEARSEFNTSKKQLHETFKRHRKVAKAALVKDTVGLAKLIPGAIPKSYINWIEANKKFYGLLKTDTEMLAKVARYKLGEEEVNQTLSLITTVENNRAVYLREIGESQDATKAKDAAMQELDTWMSEFYAVAEIALEDKPQLLETLGLKVRS